MKISFIKLLDPSYVGLTGMLNFYIWPSLQLIESKTDWSLQLGLFYYVLDLTWEKKITSRT